MTAPPALGAAASPPAPLGRIAAGGLGRLALAGAVLALAAVAVTMSGGTGLGSRFGGLFGLRSEQKARPVHVVRLAVAPPVDARALVERSTASHPAPKSFGR